MLSNNWLSTNFIYLVLHPKHKLKYFQKQGWDNTWITMAKEIVKDKFIKNYAMYVTQKYSKATASVSSKKVHTSLINQLINTTNYFFRMLTMA